MIVLNLILDIIISNYTIFNPYFFLLNFYNIPLKYLILIIVVGLYIDIFLIHTYFLTTMFLFIIYFILRKIKYKNRLGKNIFINSIIFILYVSFLYLFYNYKDLNLVFLIKFIFKNYIVYFVYNLISYKLFNRA